MVYIFILFFLSSSVLLYLSLFGFTLDPRQYRDKFAPPRRFLDQVTTARYGSHFSGSNILLLPVSPETIRQEVNVLISDLIVRLKQLLFNSLLCAYYVGFIPIQFTPVSYKCLECGS